MRMAKLNSGALLAAVSLAATLLVSCSTNRSTPLVPPAELVPAAPRPVVSPALVDAPPLAFAHLPARDPSVALVYHDLPSQPISRPRRGRRPDSASLIEKFRAQELEIWKQRPALVSKDSEPLLLEDLLRLNIEEAPPVGTDLQSLLLATKSDLPLAVNDRVLRYVNYFLGRGRTTLRESLRRAGAYQPMISRILAEEGVPQDLIYLVQAESGFRPKARSPKKATGMWQFIAGRGREYGLNQNRHVDERLDPEKATRAAARHLADLYAQFGNWHLAMAAYNCGPGGVQRAVERTGYADYWEFVRRGVLPRETSNYVPVILAMALLAKNAEAFRLDDIVPENPIRYDTVVTQGNIGLNLIADATGVTADRIKQLNPALLSNVTPNGPYSLRIPHGTAEQFEREIASVPEERRQSWRRHEVQESETLAQIAARYKVKAEAIASVNQLGPEAVTAGDWLTIPVPTRPTARGAVAGFSAAPGSGAQYTVRSGDTLSAVARRHRVTVAQLQQWNRLHSTRLDIGQVLTIRPPASLARRTGAGGHPELASTARRKAGGALRAN